MSESMSSGKTPRCFLLASGLRLPAPGDNNGSKILRGGVESVGLRFIKNIWLLMRGSQEKNTSPLSSQKTGPKALSKNLNANLSTLRGILGNSMDVVFREFSMGRVRVGVVFVDGIIDKSALRENVIRALMVDAHMVEPFPAGGTKGITQWAKDKIISIAPVSEVQDFNTLTDKILGANVALLFDGDDTSLVLNLPAFETRTVEEPHTESVVRGPREGFVESLYTNISMVRRKVKSPGLRFDEVKLGRHTKTVTCVAYIEGVAHPKVVEEVKKRLSRIDADGVLESGYIESFIEDAPFSIFPTVSNTEKPDKVAAQLLEGRVAVFTDGTPFVLTVPYLFWESLQTSEDYYSRFFSSSFMRMIRFLSTLFATCLPALYVAVSAFNPEMLPTPFMLTMAASREGMPFPALGEMLLMGTIFEVLREAGVRLPRPVGQAVSIVGALVIGEAAVAAGLVSAPAVIVTAITGIASFVVPSQADAYLFLRLSFTLLAGFLGFFGLFMGFILVLAHLVSLRSFGVPYLSPVAPLTLKDLKDIFVRAPWWAMSSRPRVIGRKNPQRLAGNLMPGPAGCTQKRRRSGKIGGRRHV